VRAFAGSSQLAVGSWPHPRGPQVAAQGVVTRLVLDHAQAVPYLAGGPWDLALSRNVPWALELRANAGHLALDLRELTMGGLRVDSAYGGVDLTLPGHCPAEMRLRLGLGDLTVTVPEGVEAKLRLALGPLATVKVDNRRLVQVAPNEWMTPLYPAKAQRCTLVVEMRAGDLRLR
jgi:hypothetical protein